MLKNLPISKQDVAQSWASVADIEKIFQGVVVNAEYGKDYLRFLGILKKDVQNKNRSVGCETIRSVLDYEIGHQLDALLGLRNMPEVQYLFDSRVTVKNGSQDFSRITSELSSYAWDNRNPNRYAEFRAEMRRRGFDEVKINEAVETRNADSFEFSVQIPFEIYLRVKILLRRYLLNDEGHLVDEEKNVLIDGT